MWLQLVWRLAFQSASSKTIPPSLVCPRTRANVRSSARQADPHAHARLERPPHFPCGIQDLGDGGGHTRSGPSAVTHTVGHVPWALRGPWSGLAPTAPGPVCPTALAAPWQHTGPVGPGLRLVPHPGRPPSLPRPAAPAPGRTPACSCPHTCWAPRGPTCPVGHSSSQPTLPGTPDPQASARCGGQTAGPGLSAQWGGGPRHDSSGPC